MPIIIMVTLNAVLNYTGFINKLSVMVMAYEGKLMWSSLFRDRNYFEKPHASGLYLERAAKPSIETSPDESLDGPQFYYPWNRRSEQDR